MSRLMKRIINIFTISVSFLAVSVSAFGQQNLRTAYFLDGYTYSYKMNPAMAPERKFTSLPILGNFGAGIESNLAIDNFLYPTGNGKLTTFLNNSVSDEQFLKGLNNLNKLNFSLNETILGTGFSTGKAFHTIDVSLKADAGVAIPKSLFAFMKTGASDGTDTWDISRMGFRANMRMELAYGYSRPISDWIRVGARVKLLVGMVNANLLIDDLNLKMNGEEWAVTAHGNAEISAPVRFETKPGSNEIDFGEGEASDIVGFLKKPSIGAAIDLGASFDFLDYFTASVSVLDLGFIGWNNTTTAVMPGGKWSFAGFENTGDDNSINDQLDQLGESLTDMLKMEMTGSQIKKTNGLAATIHAGVEARMPFYEKLSFGLLGTQRIDGISSWTEGRLSANVAPLNWFSAAASFAVSNFGSSLGGVINIHLPGFNLYAGLDSFLPLFNVTPQFVPIKSMNTNFTFGIAFLGKANKK